MQRKLLYLGHLISEKGFEPDADKIKAIQNITEPKNISELRSFLGLAGYYRKIIAKFAIVCAPLYEFTKKHAKFCWNVEHKEHL